MTPDEIKALVCLIGAAIMNGIGMCILMSMAEDTIKNLLKGEKENQK